MSAASVSRPLSPRALLPAPGPERVLSLSTLARSTGNGIVVTIVILYFTRSVGIASTQVGYGLTAAAMVGMLASVPVGHTADVFGARSASVVFVMAQGVTVWLYVLVGGFTSLLFAAGAVAVAEASSNAARGALVALAVPAADRVRTRAYLRSVTNVGFSVGALCGSFALSRNAHFVYAVELAVAGALFVLAGLVLFRVPPTPPVPRPAGAPRWQVLRDRPFVTVGVLNAVLVMNAGILNVALPLWISEHTRAPTAVFAPLLLLNTVLVIVFQVPVSKGIEDVSSGARGMRLSGLWLAGCCVVFACASGRSLWVTVGLLAAGVVVHTMGELLYSAGSWALSYELAPEHAQGQYQGMFGLSTQLGVAVTPAVTSALIAGHGTVGWVVLAVLLAAAGLAAPAVGRWALRSRPGGAPEAEGR